MTAKEPWSEKWEKLERLGKGGQGVTFRAKSKADGNQVAVLKLLKNNGSAEARRRMVREVAALATVQQAGGRVPRVFDSNALAAAVTDSSIPFYLTMELVEGETLSQLIARRGPLPLEEAVPIALDLCETIKIAHHESVLHRDLKPENVIVQSANGRTVAYILDYGLSFNDQADDGESLTRTDESFRNTFLVLPDHTFGENQRDMRSDLTALAALFYYSLTGDIPGLLRDTQGRMPHQRNSTPALTTIASSNPLVGHRLNTFFAKAFAHELNLRFQTVVELASRLTELVSGDPSPEIADPVAAAQRATDLLHRHSRRTIVSRLKVRAEECEGAINGCANALANELRQGEVRIDTLNFGDPKMPDGIELLFTSTGIQAHLQNYVHRKGIRFAIGAATDECIIYQELFNFNSVAGQWGSPRQSEMLKYPSSDSPPASLMVQHLRSQIALMIDELVQLAFDGKPPI